MDLSKNAINRLTKTITSLINIVKSIVIDFTKVKSKIKWYKSSKVIKEARSGEIKVYPKTHARLGKQPKKSS